MLNLSLTAYSKSVIPSDTLRPYCQPIWKVWKVARDLSTLDRQKILLDSANKVIELKNDAIKTAELKSQAQDSAFQAKDIEAKECRKVNELSKELNKGQLKEATKKGFKLGAIVTSIPAILLIIVLL
jgi:hypothetical protein